MRGIEVQDRVTTEVEEASRETVDQMIQDQTKRSEPRGAGNQLLSLSLLKERDLDRDLGQTLETEGEIIDLILLQSNLHRLNHLA